MPHTHKRIDLQETVTLTMCEKCFCHISHFCYISHCYLLSGFWYFVVFPNRDKKLKTCSVSSPVDRPEPFIHSPSHKTFAINIGELEEPSKLIDKIKQTNKTVEQIQYLRRDSNPRPLVHTYWNKKVFPILQAI